jgi:hypothetical protein
MSAAKGANAVKFSLDYEEFMKPEVWGGKGYTYGNQSWFGNQTYSEIVDHAIHGDDSLVDEAEKLIAKLDADIELEHPEWLPSVYGAYPIVSEYLASSPTPMRHKTQVPAENEPVGIWVDLTSSAGVSYDLIRKRGIVVLALVLKLQQLRPVDLHCCCVLPADKNGGTFIDLTMPTRPLQLGVVCHVLTCVGFARHVMYGAAQKMNNSSLGRVISEDREFRTVGDIPEKDVTIMGSHLDHVKELSNSLAWVQGMVNKYIHRDEE